MLKTHSGTAYILPLQKGKMEVQQRNTGPKQDQNPEGQTSYPLTLCSVKEFPFSFAAIFPLGWFTPCVQISPAGITQLLTSNTCSLECSSGFAFIPSSNGFSRPLAFSVPSHRDCLVTPRLAWSAFPNWVEKFYNVLTHVIVITLKPEPGGQHCQVHLPA